jgi:hypothetical protein
MVDFGSSCFNDRMKEMNQSFGISVFEVLAVGMDEKAGNGLDEFGRHL